MKTLFRIIFFSLFLIFSYCNEPKVNEKTNNGDTEYNEFVEYLKGKNISLCEIKEMRKKIQESAKVLADKKYPNSLAQHDKYIERIVDREIGTVLEKYNLKTEDWIQAWRYGDEYCK
ncbi:hypothetical protein [Flavobacterium sp.]|uniref:hypothetical protein n=1 Tax=Flavobacterium sp. TaxID=239 RepID=UPI0028BECC36|nr:hypothetical protein [Flavobacterium sp.]